MVDLRTSRWYSCLWSKTVQGLETFAAAVTAINIATIASIAPTVSPAFTMFMQQLLVIMLPLIQPLLIFVFVHLFFVLC